jgi:hypothetical protein
MGADRTRAARYGHLFNFLNVLIVHMIRCATYAEYVYVAQANRTCAALSRGSIIFKNQLPQLCLFTCQPFATQRPEELDKTGQMSLGKT